VTVWFGISMARTRSHAPANLIVWKDGLDSRVASRKKGLSGTAESLLGCKYRSDTVQLTSGNRAAFGVAATLLLATCFTHSE
jgi:hypothetical protein